MEGKFGRGKAWWIYSFQAFGERKSGQLMISHRLLIISTNLDGFSLENHERFAKFANVSPCQSFPPYGISHTNKLKLISVCIQQLQYLMNYILWSAHALGGNYEIFNTVNYVQQLKLSKLSFICINLKNYWKPGGLCTCRWHNSTLPEHVP